MTINPDGGNPFDVWCEVEGGKAWTVVHRYANGDTVEGIQGLHGRTYQEYIDGFGDVSGSFWLGLKNIRRITSIDEENQESRLRIAVETSSSSSTKEAVYNSFSLGPSNDGYRISISGHSGNLQNGLEGSAGMRFSAKDNDQDGESGRSCASLRSTGWWLNACAADGSVAGSDLISLPPLWPGVSGIVSSSMMLQPPGLYYSIKRPRGCQDVETGVSGMYTIDPRDGLGPLDVFCDFDSKPGRVFTVIHRIISSAWTDYRRYAEYEAGFGNPGRGFLDWIARHQAINADTAYVVHLLWTRLHRGTSVC